MKFSKNVHTLHTWFSNNYINAYEKYLIMRQHMEIFFEKSLQHINYICQFNSESKTTSKTMLHKLSSYIGVSQAFSLLSILNYDSPISIMFFDSSNITVLFERRMLYAINTIWSMYVIKLIRKLIRTSLGYYYVLYHFF